jgi:RNA polymerase sigma factor (sigma-70 family)
MPVRDIRPLPPTVRDVDVIRRSLEDDPERFAELYDRHAVALYRFASRRLGAQVAEDVVAETFTVAFRRRERYDPSYPDARPWLFGIAVTLIGRHRRAEVRMFRALARSSTLPVSVIETDAVDERLAAAGAGRALAEAIGELPAEQRDVLLLAAWADLSYEEIAVALRVPIGTVRSRLSRARRRVRAGLAEVSAIPDGGGTR